MEAVLDRSQQAVVVLRDARPEAADHPGRDDQRGDASAPGVAATTGATRALVPGDKQRAAVAKRGGSRDRRDDTAQPAIAGWYGAVVHGIAPVGCYPNASGRLAAARARPELAKGNQVTGARRRVGAHAGE